MAMLIITVLAASGAWLMLYFIQSSIFIPNQLNMNMLASDALRIMIEGDSRAEGLRFSRAITTANPYQVNFSYRDSGNLSHSVYYRLDTVTTPNKLYRSIDSGAEANLPYYSSGTGITMSGQSGKVFSYYNATEAATSTPANVRRVEIILSAKSGSGLFSDWQGSSVQNSSVAVKRAAAP